MSTYNCHFDLHGYFISVLFNLKELYKRIMEQRRTNQSLSFTTAITKLPSQCSLVAVREREGTCGQRILKMRGLLTWKFRNCSHPNFGGWFTAPSKCVLLSVLWQMDNKRPFKTMWYKNNMKYYTTRWYNYGFSFMFKNENCEKEKNVYRLEIWCHLLKT